MKDIILTFSQRYLTLGKIKRLLLKPAKPDKVTRAGKRAIVTALVLTTFLAFSIPNHPAKSSEETGTTVEDFTLFRYGEEDDEIFWKLTGKTGEQTDEGLIVRNFKLVIRKQDSNGDQPLSELSGERLKLQEEGEGQIAVMPGKIEISIENRFQGTAWDVRYDFSETRVTGDNLELTQSRESGTVKLAGSRFAYHHGTEELTITGGFQIDSSDSEGERTEISGEKLTWPSGENITMTGKIEASLPSGWELRAERMTWDPEDDLLNRGGSESASRE